MCEQERDRPGGRRRLPLPPARALLRAADPAHRRSTWAPRSPTSAATRSRSSPSCPRSSRPTCPRCRASSRSSTRSSPRTATSSRSAPPRKVGLARPRHAGRRPAGPGRAAGPLRRRGGEAVPERPRRVRRAAAPGDLAAPRRSRKEILEFFFACGVPVLEGYGMTETATAATVSTVDSYRFGSVGRALPGVEIRIADDGEVLLKGPNIFQGYHNNDDASFGSIVDGWLHTGDLGSVDEDGFLFITGRKKDIIITAGGKNLTPANLENDLKQSRWISQAVMHGDRRPYPVALITLDPEEIPHFAREHGLPEDMAALAQEPAVHELVQGDRRRGQLALRPGREDQALPHPRPRPLPGDGRADADPEGQAQRRQRAVRRPLRRALPRLSVRIARQQHPETAQPGLERLGGEERGHRVVLRREGGRRPACAAGNSRRGTPRDRRGAPRSRRWERRPSSGTAQTAAPMRRTRDQVDTAAMAWSPAAAAPTPPSGAPRAPGAYGIRANRRTGRTTPKCDSAPASPPVLGITHRDRVGAGARHEQGPARDRAAHDRARLGARQAGTGGMVARDDKDVRVAIEVADQHVTPPFPGGEHAVGDHRRAPGAARFPGVRQRSARRPAADRRRHPDTAEAAPSVPQDTDTSRLRLDGERDPRHLVPDPRPGVGLQLKRVGRRGGSRNGRRGGEHQAEQKRAHRSSVGRRSGFRCIRLAARVACARPPLGPTAGGRPPWPSRYGSPP